jgi:MraZ protein
MAVVTPGNYSGTEFAAIDGKGRIAVPSEFRNNVPLNAENQRVLWVGYHEVLPCLVAYGQDQFDRLADEIEHGRQVIEGRGGDFAEDAAYKARYDFTKPYTLDDSGRFLPTFSHRDNPFDEAELAFDGGACAFVGAGRRFEIWWLPFIAQCDEVDPRLRRVAAAWDANKGKGRK